MLDSRIINSHPILPPYLTPPCYSPSQPVSSFWWHFWGSSPSWHHKPCRPVGQPRHRRLPGPVWPSCQMGHAMGWANWSCLWNGKTVTVVSVTVNITDSSSIIIKVSCNAPPILPTILPNLPTYPAFTSMGKSSSNCKVWKHIISLGLVLHTDGDSLLWLLASSGCLGS